jgi:hypothetical protein
MKTLAGFLEAFCFLVFHLGCPVRGSPRRKRIWHANKGDTSFA